MGDKSIECFAPAKINYNLHIVGKRADGYHNIESLMGFLDIGDAVTITNNHKFSYEVRGPFSHHTPKDIDQDLVVQAAKLFSKQTGVDLNVKITVEKNLPAGAGMGGGSSDAAAVLKGLNTYYETNLTEDVLCEMGLTLGSELPVCIRGQLTQVSGRGEILKPSQQDIEASPIVVVWPNQICSTAEIFKNFTLPETRSGADMYNDLMDVACARYPVIKTCIEGLSAQNGCQKALMNGSGSSCYAVFDTRGNADKALQNIKNLYPSWWVKVTNPIC